MINYTQIAGIPAIAGKLASLIYSSYMVWNSCLPASECTCIQNQLQTSNTIVNQNGPIQIAASRDIHDPIPPIKIIISAEKY